MEILNGDGLAYNWEPEVAELGRLRCFYGGGDGTVPWHLGRVSGGSC